MFATKWTPGRQGGTFVAILGSRAETPSTFVKKQKERSRRMEIEFYFIFRIKPKHKKINVSLED